MELIFFGNPPPPPPPPPIALVTHWAVLTELLFLAGARVQRTFRDFDMQTGGTLSSSLHPGPPVWPEPWDSFRLGYEGARRVERGGYEGPPAEPVPRSVRPPPGFEGTEPAEGGSHGRPSIAGKYRFLVCVFLSPTHVRGQLQENPHPGAFRRCKRKKNGTVMRQKSHR